MYEYMTELAAAHCSAKLTAVLSGGNIVYVMPKQFRKAYFFVCPQSITVGAGHVQLYIVGFISLICVNKKAPLRNMVKQI